MKAYVVDTNVGVVANNKHEKASYACILVCIETLETIQKNGIIVLDEINFILREYARHFSYSGQPGLGDAFFKWVFEIQGYINRCEKARITPKKDDDSDFEEFPNDTELSGFDRSDRKFVAVAISSRKNPEILNASDTDWWIYKAALESHGLNICFLCPELMIRNA